VCVCVCASYRSCE